jgi:hypothetical protein
MVIEHKNPWGISKNGMLPPMRVLFFKVMLRWFFPTIPDECPSDTGCILHCVMASAMGIIRIRPASALPCAGPYSINAHALGRYSMSPLEMTLHIEEEITIPQCKCKWKGSVS